MPSLSSETGNFFFLRQGLSLGSNLQTVKSEGSAYLSPQYCDYKLTTIPCFFHGYCVPNSGPQTYAANPILTEPSAQLLVNVFFTNLIHENSFFLRIFFCFLISAFKYYFSSLK